MDITVESVLKYRSRRYIDHYIHHTEKHLYWEIEVWHHLSHPNIVPFLGLCYGLGLSPAIILYHFDLFGMTL
jgi:hypothetical protein